MVAAENRRAATHQVVSPGSAVGCRSQPGIGKKAGS
jgi:hypothetical protein